ncbi:MAG: ABC transporter ATP-binding protein [Deltaproteobacteria bacterium]|nr:ABC transporter ATP-binding protein [Deltaproteobacteria bacterium]
MIEVKGLTKFYKQIRAIEDVSFSVEKGDIVGFLGPNGAGKTTTMKIITGFMPPDSGVAKVAGFDVFESPLEVKKRIGYLPENPPVYNDMTVYDYLKFVAEIKGIESKKIDVEIERVSESCGITDVQKRLIAHLSKGFRQRVGIAQAILGNPEIVIFDEPTIGLDPNQVFEVRTLIKELAKEKTIILSTHILPEVEMTCKKVIVIHKGRIVAKENIEDLLRRRTKISEMTVRVKRFSIELMKQIRDKFNIKVSQPPELENGFNFELENQEDRIEDIAKFIVDGGYGLLEFRPITLSLEDVFRELTTEEKTV